MSQSITNKTKRQRLQEAWIPIELRQPPVDKTPIFVWNDNWKEAYVWEAMWAYSVIKNLLAGDIDDVSPDKRISHWMYVVPPC